MARAIGLATTTDGDSKLRAAGDGGGADNQAPLTKSGRIRGHCLRRAADHSYERLRKLVLFLMLAACLAFVVLSLVELTKGWPLIMATGNVCPGMIAPNPVGPGWSLALMIVHTISALCSVPPALWLTCVAESSHLRGAAIFALSNWLAHVLNFLEDLSICVRDTDLWGDKWRKVALLAAVMYGGILPMICGWLLIGSRLRALEEMALVRLSYLPLRTLRIAGPIIAVWSLVSVAVQPFPILYKHIGLAWVPSLLFIFMQVVVTKALVVAKHLVAEAVQHAPPDQAQRAKATAASLRLQPLVVMLAMTTTIITCGLKALKRGHLAPLPRLDTRYLGPWAFCVERLIMLLDVMSTSIAALLLSGAFRGAAAGTREREDRRRRRRRLWAKQSRSWAAVSGQASALQQAWDQQVAVLGNRGVTVSALLKFWRELPSLMPHFDPQRSTTTDVVRGAIIPMSAKTCSSAQAVLMQKQVRPDMMVTHSWSNNFMHLMAAVLADALGENCYEYLPYLLVNDLDLLDQWVSDFNVGSRAYWICAFAVNQHKGICGESRGRRDSVTLQEYPTCTCGLEKVWNDSLPCMPNGQSINCEMNKFSDMMRYLSAGDQHFGQIMAIDTRFEIFTRAWCIAELATASQQGMAQQVVVFSAVDVAAHKEELRTLSIENMQASRKEDIEFILAQIEDKAAFDDLVRRLLLEDLFPSWASFDAVQQMESVGRLVRWSKAIPLTTVHGPTPEQL